MIIESLTKRLNRTELETVLWTCRLSLLFTIGFSASLEKFNFLAVLSDHDRWKYFKESLQIKYSYIIHKHLLSLGRYKIFTSWWIVIYFFLDDHTVFLPKFTWVQFSCSVVSDSWRPHELQHARPPCRRRQWHPTPVLLPGKSHGRGSLVGCCLGVTQSQTRLKRLSSSSSG